MAVDEAHNVELSVTTLLERAESLVGPEPRPEDLRDALLAELAQSLGNSRTVLWSPRESSDTNDQQSVPPNPVSGFHQDANQPATAEAIQTAPVGTIATVPSETPTENGPAVLVASELVSGRRVVLEVHPGSQQISKSVLIELADVFAELHRRSLLTQAVARSDRFGDVMAIVSSLHRDLSHERVLQTFATDAAPVLGADRIFVAQRIRGRRYRVVSATGVDRPNPRADDVRFAERTIAAAKRAHSNGPTDSATQNDATALNLTVIPVSIDTAWKNASHAALVESRQPVDEPTLALLTHELATALDNCRRADEATLVGRLRRGPAALVRPLSLMWLAIATGLGCWLWFGKIPLKIEATGVVVPVERVVIFAPEAGVVSNIRFEDKANVERGAPLFVLRNDQLSLELEQLQGELATAQARLAALQTRRSDATRQDTATLSAERSELEIRIASLEAQVGITATRIADLTIPSPINGQAFIEGLPHEWIERPVERGQAMAEVGATAGEWQLQLNIPEQDVRHVLDVWNRTESGHGDVPVSFILETNADQRYESELQAIENLARLGPQAQLYTRASAPFDTEIIPAQPRPGAGVIASLDCGRHRAGFVYLRRLIEFVRRQPMLHWIGL